MIDRTEDLGVPRAGLPLVRDLIHERAGLFYDESRWDTLGERLAPLVIDRGFRSFVELYYLLKYDGAEDDWVRVMDALSVPETYFWREVDQIRAVACRVLPQLAASNGHGPIRIWSAACASGEEPLTIAIVLEESGWAGRVPIEIHATDASGAAIARATAGVYRERAFRATPPAIREKYFAPAGNGFEPIAALRARVTSYAVANLVDEAATAALARSPIVFCRNAFIYFSPAAIRRVVDGLARAMPRPGYLCVGASESLLSVTTAFMLEEIDGAFVYVKQ